MSAEPKAGVAPGATALASAALALHEVVREGGCTAEEALQRAAPRAEDRAAARAIQSGTLRWFLRLAPALDTLLQPGQSMQWQVRAVLICALHQIEYSRAPPASVVNIAVDAVRVLGQDKAAGFVNALLRRYVREREALLARIDRSEASATAHPRWLLRALHTAFPDAAVEVMQANNESPPMSLRVNLARGTRDNYLALLTAHGIAATPGIFAASLVLEQPMDIGALPGFAEGLVSVQDAGAQWAAELLDAQPGERILDACAAPGGKTGHILERTPGIAELLALDADASRLERVQQNLTRLALPAKLVTADLLSLTWWDGKPFDRILLDAPCSGTGVIRRHPDIKLLRREADIAGFAATQLALLARCAQMLKLGGRLLYATCSVLPAENQEVVARFLAANPAFRRAGPDQRLLPRPRSAGMAALTDGFYYASLTYGGEA